MIYEIICCMDGTLVEWNNVAFDKLYEEGYYRNLEPNERLYTDIKYLLQKVITMFMY